MTYAAITGWGKCMPPAVLGNADLATFLDTDDAWISSRTGIHERRVTHVAGSRARLRRRARALACAGLAADATSTSSSTAAAPTTSRCPTRRRGCSARLGAANAAAMDVNTACTSFLYGLSTATALIRTGVVRNALVVGVEVISPVHGLGQPQRRGALRRRRAAVVLQATDERQRLVAEQARLLRRRPPHPARARPRHDLRQPRRDATATRCGTSTGRRSSSARCTA